MAGPPVEQVIRVAEFRSALLHLLRRTERVAAVHSLTPQRYLLLLMIKGAPNGSQSATVPELSVRLQLVRQTVAARWGP